jgi:hypothetical protein
LKVDFSLGLENKFPEKYLKKRVMAKVKHGHFRYYEIL